MNVRELFVLAVQNSPNLPQSLKDNASHATTLEEHQFDDTYLGFLDEQITANARGANWTRRLRRRREALASFSNTTLVRGNVYADQKWFTVEIDPKSQRVLHWEEYAD